MIKKNRKKQNNNSNENDLDERLDKNISKIKDTINKCNLTEESKEMLKNKLIEEASKKEKAKEEKTSKLRNIKFYKYTKLYATVCVILGITISGAVFADNISNIITGIFANTTKEMEEYLESQTNLDKDEIKSIDMDYAYDNDSDIGIKVSYIAIDEENNSMYILFQFEKENLKNIYIDDMQIYDEDGNCVIDLHKIEDINFMQKRINKNNCILIYEIELDEKNIINDNLQIKINRITYKLYNNTEKMIIGNWNLNI